MEHKEIERYKYMHSGDCYLYQIKCSCKKIFGGWTPTDAEEQFNKHIEEKSK